MTTLTIDDQPAVWAPRLIDWATQAVDHYTATAEAQRRHGQMANAADYLVIAAEYRQIADRARVRLVAASQPDEKLESIEPPVTALVPVQLQPLPLSEAPGTLVELVRWLRAQWESRLPHLSTELWQSIACAVLLRRQGGAS